MSASSGGPDKVRRQHEAGKLTVRERIAALLDLDSFHEIGALAGRAQYDDRGRLTALSPTDFVRPSPPTSANKVKVMIPIDENRAGLSLFDLRVANVDVRVQVAPASPRVQGGRVVVRKRNVHWNERPDSRSSTS